MDERVLRDILQAIEEPNRPTIWRIIMKSKITKFAAVAIITIVVVLSITLLDKSIPSAYALEQTIKADRKSTV
jgi:hypothetical protein